MDEQQKLALTRFLDTIDGKIKDLSLEWDNRPCVCVVCASKGYPGKYEKGLVVDGLEEAGMIDDVVIFHAGTQAKENDEEKLILTSGGRVLGVTAFGDDIAKAIDTAYKACGKIKFDGIFFRKDIGKRALERVKQQTRRPRWQKQK